MTQKKECKKQREQHDKMNMKGGPWTKVKLERIETYLSRFARIMANKKHQTIYIDAFAGNGRVELKRPKGSCGKGFFELPIPLIDGSTRRALQVTPPFDEYLFIDNNREKCRDLNQLRQDFPQLANRIRVEHNEANEFLIDFCKNTDWTSNRAVLLLDPFGLQVKWTTIEAVAQTRAIDMLYLFPLGAVNRSLPRDGQAIKDRLMNAADKRRKLSVDTVLGPNWHNAFYKLIKRQHLLGWEAKSVKTAAAISKTINTFFIEQLRTVFPHVAERPLTLYNRVGSRMFLLYFATADPHGQKRLAIAEKILSIPSTTHDFSSRLNRLLSGEHN